MNTCTPHQRIRCLAAWFLVTALGAAVVTTVAGDLRPTGGAFDAVVVSAAAWALCAAAGWASLVTGLVALEVVRDVRLPGVPAGTRRVVLRACGVALTGSLVGTAIGPATATPGALERPTSSQVQQAPAPPAGPVATPTSGPERVTTRPGDSLWRVAEAELRGRTGQEPSDAEVAAYWPRIHATNRVLLGPDPDFVLPGVPLVLPAADQPDPVHLEEQP